MEEQHGKKVRRAVIAAGTAVVAALAVLLAPGTAQAVTTWHTGSGRPALADTGDRLYLAYSEGCNPACFHDASSGTPQIASGVGMSGGARTATRWSYFDPTGHLVIDHF